MSDNGWYVLETEDLIYLVCEQVSLHPDEMTREELLDAFSDGISFDLEIDAMRYAKERSDEALVCEHGVVFLTLDDALDDEDLDDEDDDSLWDDPDYD